MAQLIVRRLDDAVKTRLKVRARKNRRSLEAEARAILEEAVNKALPTPSRTKKGFGTLMHERFKDIGFTDKEKREFDKAIEEMWHNNPPRFVEFKK